jgi:hypothetical protein
MTRPQYLESLDVVEEIQGCLETIESLIDPTCDLQQNDREGLAMLIGRLLREQNRELAIVRAAIPGGQP